MAAAGEFAETCRHSKARRRLAAWQETGVFVGEGELWSRA